MAGKREKILALDVLYPRSLKYLNTYLQSLIRGPLWLQGVVSMVPVSFHTARHITDLKFIQAYVKRKWLNL